jgi:hypothetical protein
MFGSRGIIRRSFAITAAVLIAGAVSIAAAPGASADQSLSQDCSVDGSLTLPVVAGETITIAGFEPGSCIAVVAPDNGGFYAAQPVGNTIVYVINPNALPGDSGTTTWSGTHTFVYTFVIATPVAPPTAVRDQTPPPWQQSYARATADEKCLAGWNPSYAMWPNDGKGGWVCVRTLHYNNSTKTWDAN